MGSNLVPPPRRKLRIVQALETSGPGGAEHMLLQLSEALRQAGHDVTLATMQEGWMTERARALGIPVWLTAQDQGVSPGWIWRLSKRLRHEKIDILHTHDFEMNVFGGVASRIARVASVSTVHGRHWIADRRRRTIAYRWLRKLGIPIIAVSEDLAGFLVECLSLRRDQLEVVYNGIDLSGFGHAQTQSEAEARSALGLPLDGPLVVAVGNLYPVKDHGTLLRAVARLPAVRIAIAGRGDEKENLERLAIELGIEKRVHLLGLRDDIDRVLAAGTLFAQPSLSEGLPLALLEAMAAKLPVVASKVGGMIEAIVHGETGILTPAADADALAQSIDALLSDDELRRSMGEAGRRRAEENFSVTKMSQRYEDLYRSRLSNDALSIQRNT